MTHMRLRDAASMQRAKEATQELRSMTMGPTRMPGTPFKVATPKMDITRMSRTPLRAPTVGRFHHMAFVKVEEIGRASCRERVF